MTEDYQLKALATTTNNRAELNDLYGDVVYETLNLKRNFYNFVPKVKSWSDRYGFRVRTGANPSAGSYDELDVIVTGNTTRKRVYFPIKLEKVGVEVSGFAIESAKGEGGIGDLWAEEIRTSTEDFLVKVNEHLLGDADPNSSIDISGLEYLIDDGTTYTSYGSVPDRTVAGEEWAQANYDATAGALALTDMRTMIRTCVEDGANPANLVFWTSPYQEQKFKDLIQNLQQLVPTSSRVGFEGRPEFDGVPLMTDHQIANDIMYCLDMSTIKMPVLKEPTLDPLPEPKDADAAFLKMYGQLICTAPKMNYKRINLT